MFDKNESITWENNNKQAFYDAAFAVNCIMQQLIDTLLHNNNITKQIASENP